jgi:hypothetical protein
LDQHGNQDDWKPGSKPPTLVVEAVDTVDGGALVVTTEDEEVFGVLDLVGEEKADGLKGLLASVDVIAEEEVVGFWWETAILEQPQKVIVLAVDITCADVSATGPKPHQRTTYLG